jgi:AcrR family transcriptional regulator
MFFIGKNTMGSPTSKKVLDAETKARLEAAVKELFSQQDFHQVNMRCIAQKTGVGLNTIYMHYESKERLLFAFVNEWIQNLDNRLVEHLQGLEDVKEKIRKTIWVILDFYEKNPDIGIIVTMTVPFKTWITDDTFKQKDLSMRVIDLLKEGQNKGMLDPGIPANFMFDILFGVIHRIVYIWLYLKQNESMTSKINMYFDTLWRAIENPEAKKISS